MKGKLLREWALTDLSRKRLKILADLKPASRTLLAEWFSKAKNPLRFDTVELRELTEKTGESAGNIDDAVGMTWVLVRKLGEVAEHPKAFVDDLQSLQVIEKPEDCAAILEYLERLSGHWGRLFLVQQTQRTVGDGAPELRGGSTSVTIKPVYRARFRYAEDDIATYNPQPVAYVAVGQIELQRTGDNCTFAVQMDMDTLDRFVTDLLASQMELKQANVVANSLSGTCTAQRE